MTSPLKMSNQKSKQNRQKKSKRAELKLVPICEHNTVEVDGLYESLQNVVDRYIERKGMTVAEIVGTLESLKHEILEDYE